MTTQTKTAPRPVRSDLGWRQDLTAPLVIVLTLLLALQLLLSLGLGLGGQGANAPSAQTALISVKPSDVSKVVIEGAAGAKVTLSRTGEDKWVVANLADFPAAGSQVEQMLTELTSAKRALPIATSEAARKRFKVADDGFERRLTVETKDGATVTLLLGESAGFRRLFGRPADDPAVYDLPIPVADVTDRADDWLDRGQLRVDQDKIKRMAAKDWALLKGPDGWSLTGSDAPVEQSAATDLAMKLGNLGYRGVIAPADEAGYTDQKPTLEVAIELTEGPARAYQIFQDNNGADFILKAADRPYYFKLSADDLEGVIDVDAAKLKAKPPATDKAAAAPKTGEPAGEPPAPVAPPVQTAPAAPAAVPAPPAAPN